jgi:hypothetical protein
MGVNEKGINKNYFPVRAIIVVEGSQPKGVKWK